MRNQSLICTAISLALAVPTFAASDKPIAPIATAYSKLSAPADPDKFEFVVTGDNRSTGHGYPMPPAFAEICREIGIVHPAFTLWTGDCIEGYGDTVAEANAEYDVFLKGLDLTNSPVFNAPGNHEFSLDKALLPVYLKRIGVLYGSFDYGNSHFIALNSNAVGADGTITGGKIDDEQAAWLEADLKANATARNIFVFMHHYIFGPVDPDDPKLPTGMISLDEQAKLHSLFVKYGVRAVYCGHNHIYHHETQDSVDYYISGGTGAPLDATPEQGGYLHFLVVHVDGAKVTNQILQPWRLDLAYQSGSPLDEKAASTGSAWLTNENHEELSLTVPFRVKAGTGALAASARIAYKGKTKDVPATIVSSTPGPSGAQTVLVSVPVKAARTVEVSLAPRPVAAAR